MIEVVLLIQVAVQNEKGKKMIIDNVLFSMTLHFVRLHLHSTLRLNQVVSTKRQMPEKGYLNFSVSKLS